MQVFSNDVTIQPNRAISEGYSKHLNRAACFDTAVRPKFGPIACAEESLPRLGGKPRTRYSPKIWLNSWLSGLFSGQGERGAHKFLRLNVSKKIPYIPNRFLKRS